jgi:replicative DNA helicase
VSQAKFPFDRDFQVGILALMSQQYDFLVMAVEIFEDSYFEDKVLVWFYQVMADYCTTYGAVPNRVVLENELKKALTSGVVKGPELPEYVGIMKALDQRVNAQQYVTNEVVRFCRRQVGRKVYLDTAPIMDTADEDDWDQILDRLHEARNIGSNHLDVGSNFFAEIKERIARRASTTVRRASSTGIKGYNPISGQDVDLDVLLGGGLREGQLGIWMGGTGVGKSIALPHVGRHAVLKGWKVVHYTLELSKDDTTDRYDAGFADTNIGDLTQNHTHIQSELTALMQGTKTGFGACADRLYVQAYPTGTATVNTLRSHLRRMEGLGWYPDVIIVDYMDLLKPLTSYNDEYADLGGIAKDLRGLAGEYKVPLWSATQVNRAGLGQEVVDVEHIGDSLKKAQIADIILALCATREERENSGLRIFGAKNRNGPSKFTVEIRSLYERMRLYDPLGVALSKLAKQTVSASSAAKQPGPIQAPGMSPAKTTGRRRKK